MTSSLSVFLFNWQLSLFAAFPLKEIRVLKKITISKATHSYVISPSLQYNIRPNLPPLTTISSSLFVFFSLSLPRILSLQTQIILPLTETKWQESVIKEKDPVTVKHLAKQNVKLWLPVKKNEIDHRRFFFKVFVIQPVKPCPVLQTRRFDRGPKNSLQIKIFRFYTSKEPDWWPVSDYRGSTG